MRTGRPKAALMVSAEQREELERWVRRRSTAQALALRARIILSCAEGGSNKDVASRLGMSRLTVGRWRSRFIRSGVDGLLDEPRPGAPRKISDAAVEKAVTLTLESKPRDATHWSTRSLAKRVGLSRSSVARIWRAFGLRPHRSESFKLSTEPLLIEKVRDIVGLYLDPPDRAVVLCVDEKPQIQALDRSQRGRAPAAGIRTPRVVVPAEQAALGERRPTWTARRSVRGERRPYPAHEWSSARRWSGRQHVHGRAGSGSSLRRKGGSDRSWTDSRTSSSEFAA
jgi:transposase